MISEFRNYTWERKNPLAIKELIISLKQLDISGTLYLGYPIIASVDDSIVIDALLVSEDIGLIVFSILEETIKSSIKSSNEDKLNDIDGKLYYAVKANLERHESLRKGRNIAVKINIVLYSTNLLTKIGDIKIATSSTIAEVLKGCEKTDSLYFKALNAAIQRVTTLKPKKKRDNVTKNNSKGWKLKEIERKIANLDRWQKQSAIETPEGPQR
ncbi:MAG: RNA helicase, partial [Nitrospirae bacterium]|nr:RNA helicase [Nitrospirota bacterium]